MLQDMDFSEKYQDLLKTFKGALIKGVFHHRNTFKIFTDEYTLCCTATLDPLGGRNDTEVYYNWEIYPFSESEFQETIKSENDREKSFEALKESLKPIPKEEADKIIEDCFNSSLLRKIAKDSFE